MAVMRRGALVDRGVILHVANAHDRRARRQTVDAVGLDITPLQ